MPIANGIEILNCAVVVCSDSVSQKAERINRGKAIVEKLKTASYVRIYRSNSGRQGSAVQSKLNSLVAEGYRLIIFTGGTGLSPRDITPDAVEPLLDRQIPGIMEAARNYGQQRTPYAMLSRGVAGFINDSLVLTLPGSEKAVIETMDALFPHILHVFQSSRRSEA